MFKKAIKISGQNQLSGKDRKIMRNRLVELFNEECIDKIMNINDKIIACKTSGTKVIIYNGNDYPLFVDQNGKNDYFPTLYTAIAYEPLIKILVINQGVEAYIYNGANLMWPGVLSYGSLGKFQKNQVVGIRSSKGELMAIGAMGCSLKQLQQNADKNGIAVFILHYLNDNLWGQGTKMKPQVIMAVQKMIQKKESKEEQTKGDKKQKQKDKTQKKGKKQQQQTKIQNKKSQQQVEIKQKGKKQKKSKKNIKQKQQQQQQQTKIDKKKQQQKNEKKKQKQQQKIYKKKQQQKQQQEQNDDDQQLDYTSIIHTKKQRQIQNKPIKIQIKQSQKGFKQDIDDKKQKTKKKQNKKQIIAKQQNKKKQPKKSYDDDQQKSNEGQKKQQITQHKQQQQKSIVSTKLMDQQFKQVFLNVLKLSKIQGQLPIDSGRFFIDFMLLARPQGIKLQIKDTSYKKLGKFYQDMSKQKFIEFKHNKDKKGQSNSQITKIHWQNEQLKNYEPTITKLTQKDIQQKQDTLSSKKILKLSQSIQIQNTFKLHPDFKNVISEIYSKKNQNQDIQSNKYYQPQYYTQNQVKSIIQKYIDKFLKKDKEKQKDKAKQKDKDKQKKTDKMLIIDYKNNPYLSQLLKKQIQQFQQNLQADKQIDSNQQQQTKKIKKKKQNVLKIQKNTLINRILKTCSNSHRIRDKENNYQGFFQGCFKGIQLIAQKSNNKNVTKIIGLQTFIVTKQKFEEPVQKLKPVKKQAKQVKQVEQSITGVDKQKKGKGLTKKIEDEKSVSSSMRKEMDEQIDGFANILKQKFACSVNVQHLPGRNAGKEIIVHGNFINELQQIFTKQYKLNEEYVTSQNKLDKKKKR